MTHSEIVSFIWGVADLIRDTFRRGKYQDVILPFTVLRRLDCVLVPTKKKVLETNAKFKGKLDKPDAQLRKASGFAFYNTSRHDFDSLLDDHTHLKANLRHYIKGFSENMQEVLERFDFDTTIAKLDEAGLLFKTMERFGQIDLHPDRVSNPLMGTIFEELIRKFNEALNENPGEHFTPRDVVHLMVELLLAGDEKRLSKPGVVLKIYDPCAGSGGMLTITKDHIVGTPDRKGVNPKADVRLYGQEVNPETFAICKSDLFIKSADGRDADNIVYGSTLSNPPHKPYTHVLNRGGRGVRRPLGQPGLTECRRSVLGYRELDKSEWRTAENRRKLFPRMQIRIGAERASLVRCRLLHVSVADAEDAAWRRNCQSKRRRFGTSSRGCRTQ